MANYDYDQMIYDAAVSEGFSPTAAKLVVAQARLESADYTSNVFQNNYNMFGMKYIGQPLANRGTAAPKSEQSCNLTCNSDYYAKYETPADSARDVVGRLFKITRKGIGFNELKDVTSATEYAQKLKQRDYFGVTAASYALSLNAKLLKITALNFYNSNKIAINYIVIGASLIGIGVYIYYLNAKGIIKLK
jgi:flagellum-specific peptidoglycan hydrolase FlgJ